MAFSCDPTILTLFTECGSLNQGCYLYRLDGGIYTPVPGGVYARNGTCARVSYDIPGYIVSSCDCPLYYRILRMYSCNDQRYISGFGVAGWQVAAYSCNNAFVPVLPTYPQGNPLGTGWYAGYVQYYNDANPPVPALNMLGAFQKVAFQIANTTNPYFKDNMYYPGSGEYFNPDLNYGIEAYSTTSYDLPFTACANADFPPEPN